MPISALTRLSRTGQKYSEKKFFVREYSAILKYRSHRSFTKVFEQNFYQNITVCLVRIWTYKNADEKAHTFFVDKQKRKKTGKNGPKTDTV